jgi:NitT/TauT family transport system permease protein
MRSWAGRAGLGTLGVGLLLVAWYLAARAYTPEQFPGPLHVVAAVREQMASGELGSHIRVSLGRFAAGYALAVLLALPLGLVLGWWTRGRQILDPVFQILRPISPIAWFPLAVLWLGVGSAPAVFIITLAAFFPVLLSTVGAVRNVPAGYLRVAATFGASPLLIFRAVLLPAAFPSVVVGLRIALGAAWIHLVAGEMLGAQAGLGFLIVDARNFLRTDLIVACMLIVGVLGLCLDRLVAAGELRVRRAWGQP